MDQKEPEKTSESMDYQRGPTSPYDRPVERYVRWAARMKLIRRPPTWIKWGILLPAIFVLLWYVRHEMLEFEHFASGK